MSTRSLAVYDTLWVQSPGEVLDVAMEAHVTAPAGGPMTEAIESSSAQLTKVIFADFVKLVEGIPKVWAVYIRSDSPVVHVWTFVDSTDWRDRSPVYEAEWEMLNRHPETPFDFNVELDPAGSEDFEGEKTAFVFKR
jgi:hypothetical protein